jgi:cysteine peptidase C11 family protein
MFKIKYFLLLIIPVLLFSACSKKDEAEWTILVYMAADNGLNNAAEEDINEMERAIFSENINVIVQIDNNAGNSSSGAYRYKIQQDESEEITSPVISALGEIDSGDYGTLRNFIDWGYSHYPSEKQALVIWSHGSGWYNFYNQFCPDYESQSAIDIPSGDLRDALNGLTGLDILMLDACYMQTVEVLFEVGNSFHYVIGSEDELCADGFPYDDILNHWEEQQGVSELSIRINELLYDSYYPGGSQNNSNNFVPITSSVFRTAYLFDLKDEITSFQQEWAASAWEEYFLSARETCYEFNALEADVDIKQYFSLLLQRDLPDDLQEKCENIVQLLDNAFISQEFIDYPADNIGTAVIWFPDDQFDYESLRPQYEELLFDDTGWSIFLENSLTP